MWEATFRQDTEEKGTGTATAKNGEFTYSRRMSSVDMDDVAKFISEAKDKFDSVEAVKIELVAIADIIAAKLNG